MASATITAFYVFSSVFASEELQHLALSLATGLALLTREI
jgi:hypothetical protein